jgi:protein-S-isoprenylcysteine O-methyltransferase Ste14
MEIVGRATIHPTVFYSGKLCGYLTWVLIGLDFLGVHPLSGFHVKSMDYVSYILSVVASVFIVFSSVNLGKSIRLGLPTGSMVLKTQGLYRISRNPMYLGFDMLTLAAILKIGNPAVLLLGSYSIIVYHMIILGEEAYLASTFGEAYSQYRARVRRYL